MAGQLKRGEIWTVSGASDYAGKPRPSLILQSDAFDAGQSITVCGFTSDLANATLIRVRVEPTEHNGLFGVSDVMADKITTVARQKLGRKIGALEAEIMEQVDTAVVTFLGLSRDRSN